MSSFAIAVNEVNASLGRVVTAPTNGSAGVIPAVLMYYLVIENHLATWEDIKKFLLTAGEIGSIFKKGRQFRSNGRMSGRNRSFFSMAAGALCELMGGTPEQCLMASEIAMEHHLGLTCDRLPVGTNSLHRTKCDGALKAINACEIALHSDPSKAKVSLDDVVATMWATAQDMTSKYKETSEGGLAVQVNISDC